MRRRAWSARRVLVAVTFAACAVACGLSAIGTGLRRGDESGGGGAGPPLPVECSGRFCDVSCSGSSAGSKGVRCVDAGTCNIACTGTTLSCSGDTVECSARGACHVTCDGGSSCNKGVSCEAG